MSSRRADVLKNFTKSILLPALFLIAGAFLVLGGSRSAIHVIAFNSPTSSPPGGSGAIAVDSSNNIAIGTSTVLSNTRFLIVASSASAADYSFKVLQNGTNNTLFSVRNDGAIFVNSSTPINTGYLVNIEGDLIARNINGNVSGQIHPENILSGIFGQNVGGGNFAFPSKLGVGTSSTSVPSTLSVYGNGYFTGSVGIGTSSPQAALEVVGAMRVTSGTASVDFSSSQSLSTAYIATNASTLQLQNQIFINGLNVGVNTSTPAYNLDVNGTLRTLATSTFLGKVGIGTTTPQYALHVVGDIRATGDVCNATICLSGANVNISGNGQAAYLARWAGGSTLGTSTITDNLTQVTVNLPNNINSYFNVVNGALLVSGNTATAVTPTSSVGIRLMFIPAKRGAFRTGEVDAALSNAWDDFNIGLSSFASGHNTIANGDYSFAVGDTTQAGGIASFAAGNGTAALGDYSFAVGVNNRVTGKGSFATGGSGGGGTGNRNQVVGNNSFANGTSNNVYGNYAFVTGNGNNAYGNGSFAAGNANVTGGDYSVGIGQGVYATGTAAIAIGNGASSTAAGAISIGTGQASGIDSVAIGGAGSASNGLPYALADYSIAIGRNIQVTKPYSIGIGLGSVLNTLDSGGVFAVLGGNVGIGTSNPSSPLDVAGPITIDTLTVSTNLSVPATSTYGTIYANNVSPITITLPSTASGIMIGRMYQIVRAGTANVTIAPASGNYINGVLNGTYTIPSQWQMVKVIGYDPNSWIINKLGL